MSNKKEQSLNLAKLDLEKKHYPDIISIQYNALYNMLDNKEYYGALYQIKDVFEIMVKYPLIVLLYGMESFIRKDSVSYQELKKNEDYEGALAALSDLLQSGYHLGDWEKTANRIKSLSIEDLPIDHSYDEIYKLFLKILKQIMPIYTKNKITLWRNDEIGHGAVKLDVKTVEESLNPLLAVLNTMIEKADYSQVETIHSCNSYSIRNINNKQLSIEMKPYICAFAIIFESYYRYQNRAKTINYINGEKSIDEDLSKLYKQLMAKMNFPAISSNSVDDNRISEQDVKALQSFGPQKLQRIDPFYKYVRQIISSKKAIALIEAERGMGKTVFSRCFSEKEQDQLAISGESRKLLCENELNGDSQTTLFVFSYNFNSSWRSRENVFFEKLHSFVLRGAECDCGLSDAYDSLKQAIKSKEENSCDLFNNYLKTAYRSLADSVSDGSNVKFLVLLDGIDELCETYAEKSGKSIDLVNIFDEKGLPKNVYIVMLARTAEEYQLPKAFYEKTAGSRYILKRNSIEYIACLDEYLKRTIFKENESLVVYRENLLNFADYRILYLDMLYRIYLMDNMALQEQFTGTYKHTTILSVYLETIKLIDKTYKEKIENTLYLLYKVNSAITLAEINYIINDTYGVDFKVLALTNDIRGFLNVERTAYRKELYSLSNIEWCTEIEHLCNFAEIKARFANEIERRGAELINHIRCNSAAVISNTDILLLSLMDNMKTADCHVCSRILDKMIAELWTEENYSSLYNREKYKKIFALIKQNWLEEQGTFKLKIQLHLVEYLLEKESLDYATCILKLNAIVNYIDNNISLTNIETSDIAKLYIIALYEKAVINYAQEAYKNAFIDADFAENLLLMLKYDNILDKYYIKVFTLRNRIYNMPRLDVPYQEILGNLIEEQIGSCNVIKLIEMNLKLLEANNTSPIIYWYYIFQKTKSLIQQIRNNIRSNNFNTYLISKDEEKLRKHEEDNRRIELRLISILNKEIPVLETLFAKIQDDFVLTRFTNHEFYEHIKLDYLRVLYEYARIRRGSLGDNDFYTDKFSPCGTQRAEAVEKILIEEIRNYGIVTTENSNYEYYEFLKDILRDKENTGVSICSEIYTVVNSIFEQLKEGYNSKLLEFACYFLEEYKNFFKEKVTNFNMQKAAEILYKHLGPMCEDNSPNFRKGLPLTLITIVEALDSTLHAQERESIYNTAYEIILSSSRASSYDIVEAYLKLAEYFKSIGNMSYYNLILQKCDPVILHQFFNIEEEADNWRRNLYAEEEDIESNNMVLESSITEMHFASNLNNPCGFEICYERFLNIMEHHGMAVVFDSLKLERICVAASRMGLYEKAGNLVIPYFELLQAAFTKRKNPILAYELQHTFTLLKTYCSKYYTDDKLKLDAYIAYVAQLYPIMSFEKENFPTMTVADIKQIFFLMFDKSFNNYEVLVQNINDLASNNDLYNKVKVNQSFYKWYKEFVRASAVRL